MRKDKHQHNFNDFSDQEKEKLKTVRQELAQAQKKNLKDFGNIYKLLMMA